MTTKYVAVIPSIYQPYTDACVAGCKLDNLIVVDNTVINIGVPASWNIGVRQMYETGADWTIIISASVRFGKPGGLDLVEAMGRYPDALAVEGGDYDCSKTSYAGAWRKFDEKKRTPIDGFGWHLIAVHRRTFDAIGLFDENFWPGYGEDTDFRHRMAVCYEGLLWDFDPLWPRVPIDGRVAYIGHGVDLGKAPFHCAKSGNGRETQMEYYARKWGGEPHSEWKYPFNDLDNPLSYWPTPVSREGSA
jgi:hypothetical protein